MSDQTFFLLLALVLLGVAGACLYAGSLQSRRRSAHDRFHDTHMISSEASDPSYQVPRRKP